MSKIQTTLSSVRVLDGQGVGEGDLELRLEVQDSGHSVIWPAPNSSAKIDNKGPAFPINEIVGTYIVDAPVTKQYTVLVTEVDKGTLGQDDYGSGTISFDMTPTMALLTRSVTIDLHRPKMKTNGQVTVTMIADKAPHATA
jgi:hypothetical protein